MLRMRSLCVGALLGAASLTGGCSPSSSSDSQQSTTTFPPTTTIDLDALNATWASRGSWLIRDPGATGTEIDGFASFDPQVDGDRYVSTGYGKCFMFGGRAVESDGLTQVAPIEGADVGRVACDPGPSTDTYDRVVECLQAGCRIDLIGDVMSLSTSAGEPVADLIRTADEIPPP
ncbi:MAG: hypothetical protein WBL31_12325 [Ilumatobacteraceae bacterium]